MNLCPDVVPLKFIVVGECQVGKSCLVRAFSELPFDSSYSATVGVTFTVKQVVLGDLTLRIQLWDTAGQEIYRSITQTYYRDAHCAFVVYDMTEASTFSLVSSWIADVRKICPPHCVIVLVGNKSDCATRRQIAATEVAEFAEKEKITAFECSAKTGDRVIPMFRASIDAVLERRKADLAARAVKERALVPAQRGKCCG
jgi:small GTP-binding protein